MTATILEAAERDLELAFDYYQAARDGLGHELLDEFRRGVDWIVEYPSSWPALDDVHRRYRLHRFPYAIIYRLDLVPNEIVITAFGHLHRKPGWWRDRA